MDFFTKQIYEAAVTEPPFIPYPDPEIRMEPWTPYAMDLKRVMEAESAKQRKYGTLI